MLWSRQKKSRRCSDRRDFCCSPHPGARASLRRVSHGAGRSNPSDLAHGEEGDRDAPIQYNDAARRSATPLHRFLSKNIENFPITSWTSLSNYALICISIERKLLRLFDDISAGASFLQIDANSSVGVCRGVGGATPGGVPGCPRLG